MMKNINIYLLIEFLLYLNRGLTQRWNQENLEV